MNSKDGISKPTKDLQSFLESLPSARNVRVYTDQEQKHLDLKNETVAVRRSVIRSKNS
ncbi:hypothetical protein [Pseudoalteromonas luteoviolacea]|uniref:hypothetical protein n=1 Tax=Pseudoalteromonas luteoviolacea TaxID=43657 RepID=UPI001B369B32|nr:hypothetical protein [Pseudoalteromonas luteoviolacea]MBQ4840171.1 hypothetical protein [Pseudoalteromonas luteoviolacea]